MYAAWLSFKENMYCSQRGIEAFRPRKVNQAGEIDCDENVYCQNTGPERFRELETGDSSRNIIEIIFQTTSMWKRMKKIERVMKVTKLPEVLQKFEDYREKVKKHARNNSRRHPRSVVDGNELLSFYVTTMSCCPPKDDKITHLCRNAACGVCTLIQSGFRDVDPKVTDSCKLSAIGNGHCKGARRKREVKKAVVLCRVIAGTVVDAAEEGNMGLSNSHGYSEGLSVKNPNGILPCFVIIYS